MYYFRLTKEDRQEELKLHFGYTTPCNCKACVGEWPEVTSYNNPKLLATFREIMERLTKKVIFSKEDVNFFVGKIQKLHLDGEIFGLQSAL